MRIRCPVVSHVSAAGSPSDIETVQLLKDPDQVVLVDSVSTPQPGAGASPKNGQPRRLSEKWILSLGKLKPCRCIRDADGVKLHS